MNTNCPFCDINKEKSRIIRRYKYCFVMFSNPRLMEGHLLVVPKRHVEKLSDLNKNELQELIDVTTKYQEKILKNISPGCDISHHYRPFIKNNKLKVEHLHIHLRPRFDHDELYQKSQIHEKQIFKTLPKLEINKIMKLLK